ncbi:hypothetical protein PTKIN_Ptkin10aG0057800 [Pterospermum kingtungense]
MPRLLIILQIPNKVLQFVIPRVRCFALLFVGMRVCCLLYKLSSMLFWRDLN